jgi:chromate transporter
MAGGETARKASGRARWAEVAAFFLRLGCSAFGGPAAHIALMENEAVRKRSWLTHERFLDLLAVSNLLPGPSSTELALFIGYERAGFVGLLLAGACFIAPAFVLAALFASLYVRFGSLPEVYGAFYGIKPVVLAIVAQTLWNLAPKAIRRSPVLVGIAVLACAAFAAGLAAALVLFAAGLASLAVTECRARASSRLLTPLWIPGVAVAKAGSGTAVGVVSLFWVFVKIGATAFGSGYVLLAFLRSELVEQRHWLTPSALIDAVAVGQVTPGPVFTTATFIGYLLRAGAGPLAAWAGAVAATAGIFLPGFALVALVRPALDRIKESSSARAFLDGANVASLALMATVGVQLGASALVDVSAWLVGIGSLVALVATKINPTWLVAAGAMVGALLTALR